MTVHSRQRGYLLITVVVMLFLLATIAVLLTYDSANNATAANSELEAARAEYVARAGMQNALWRAQNNACLGDVTIPATALGGDTYAATITGASAGNLVVVNADQDAWIRSDDPSTNNGTSTSNHVRFETPDIEQVLTRFDVSAISSKAQINSAIAWFHLKSLQQHPEGLVSIHEIMSDWDENTVTWDSFNGAFRAGRVAAIPAQEDGDTWIGLNITGLVQAWVNGQPNYGILFNSTAEGLHTEYTSREDGANPPRLEVVVGSGPASPVTIEVAGTLASGISRTLTQSAATAYQPPGQTMLQPDASGVEDAWITSGQTDWNYGAHGTLRVQPNNQRTFLRMDLQGHVPVGAKVTKATLELWTIQVNTADSIDIRRVARPWEEGSCFGNCAADDGITWDTYDGANAWHTPGGDVDANAVSSATPSTNDAWLRWDLTELAATWAASPSTNYGVLLKGNPGSAVFASSDEADPNLHPRLTIEYACECGSPCMAPSGSGNILMVVSDATNMWYYDVQKKDILESWGYTVNVIDDDATQGDYDAGIAANDVAYISEPMREASLNTKLSAAAIGVVSDEGRMNDELGLADFYATPVLGREINVSDNSHYITSVFPTGSLEIYSATMEALTIDGNVSPDAQELADWGGTASLVLLDAGKQTVSGGTVAARRIVLPFGRQVDSNLNWDSLNANGRLLVNRAIQWAANPPAACTSTSTILFVVGDATSPSGQETARQSLLESWCFAVTRIDDADSQSNFDTAAANADVAYISSEISGSALGTKLKNNSIGIVNEDPDLHNDYGFSTVRYRSTTNAPLSTDSAHYITSPFAGADITLFTSIQPAGAAVGTLPSGLNTLGTWTSGDLSPLGGLLTLDTGAAISGGGTAAGRRVQMPWDGAEGGAVADIGALTANGETLLQRSLEWAAGLDASTGPIAHWKLDETSGTTAIDSVGGHHGTLTNGPAWAPGIVDGALDFDGTDDYVDLTTDEALTDVFGDGATVTAWIYLRSWGESDNGRILDKASQVSGDRDGWMIGVRGATPAVQFAQGFTGVRGFWRSEEGTVALNEWVHVAVSYDASSVTNDADIYLNGIRQSPLVEITPTGSIATDAGIALRMGNYAQDTSRTFDGIIDDVRIYDRMLAPDEIADLAERPSALPIAHWTMDEMNGTIASDSAGGHDASLLNGTSWGSGKLDGATLFDGGNDFLDVPHDDALSLTQEMSFSAWINASSFGTSYQTIVAKDDGGAGSNYWFGTWRDDLVFGFFANGLFREVATTGLGIQANVWNHVAATFDDSLNMVSLYLNGAEVANANFNFSPTAVTANLALGRSPDGEYWRGMLDDVRIYDRVLDSSEITSLADPGGAGGGGSSGSTPVFEEFADASASSGTTSLNIPKPGGTVAGDLLIAALATDGDSGTSFNPPSGWTPVSVGTSANNRVSFGVWWKIATGSEPAQYSFTWSGSEEAYGWVSRFTGHNPTNPIHYDNGTLTNDSTAGPICQRLNTTEDNVLILRLGGFDDDDVNIGNPGLDGHTAINMGESGGGAGTTSGGSGYFIQTTAGDSGFGYFQLTNNEEMRTVTLGIRPE